jgi:hypothetical protein
MPSGKQNGGINTCRGVVMHSMVGSLAPAMGELDNPERRASWHYSVCQNGDVYCHADDEVQTWHAGSARNNDLIGIEHEGGLNPYDEPLTPAQLAASVALVCWLAQAHGFSTKPREGMFEHNWVSGAPTACPSHRVPFEAYQGGDEMTAQEQAAFDELTAKVAELAKQQFELAVDQNKRLVAIEDKLAIPHD